MAVQFHFQQYISGGKAFSQKVKTSASAADRGFPRFSHILRDTFCAGQLINRAAVRPSRRTSFIYCITNSLQVSTAAGRRINRRGGREKAVYDCGTGLTGSRKIVYNIAGAMNAAGFSKNCSLPRHGIPHTFPLIQQTKNPRCSNRKKCSGSLLWK